MSKKTVIIALAVITLITVIGAVTYIVQQKHGEDEKVRSVKERDYYFIRAIEKWPSVKGFNIVDLARQIDSQFGTATDILESMPLQLGVKTTDIETCERVKEFLSTIEAIGGISECEKVKISD